MSFKNEGEMNTFLDEGKWREFISSSWDEMTEFFSLKVNDMKEKLES